MTWKIHNRQANSADSISGEAAINEEIRPDEPVSPPEDPLAPLKAEITATKAELEQLRDRFLRKAAEFENFRKRVEKERNEASMLVKSSVLLEFLPVADACERALQSLTEAQDGTEALEHYRAGVRLLYKQINDVMHRLGVVAIAAKGQQFDPHLHEAVTREEDPEHEENTVIMELRRGYLLGDRLLRPAQVKVSARPPIRDSSAS